MRRFVEKASVEIDILERFSSWLHLRSPRKVIPEIRGGVVTCLDSHISILDDPSMLEAEWRNLEISGDMTPFQAFDWYASWQRTIGLTHGATSCIVVGRKQTGGIIFILPFTIVRAGPLRVLTWASSEINDYNAPILVKDFSNSVVSKQFADAWTIIRNAITAHQKDRIDFISFAKMPEAVGMQANPFLQLSVALNASRAHATKLPGSWDELYGRRSSSTRRRDRTKLRRLSEFGEVSFAEPTGTQETLGIIKKLVDLKTQHLARIGTTNLFAKPEYGAFLGDIATNHNSRNLIHVSCLRVGETLAAMNFGLRFRGCYYHVLMSYELGEIGKFGPGAAHLRELLRNAIESRMDRFDFTIGDESYKKEWCDLELQLYDHLSPCSLRGLVAVAVGKTYLGAKRRIKNSPLAWRLYRGARLLAGRIRNPTTVKQNSSIADCASD